MTKFRLGNSRASKLNAQQVMRMREEYASHLYTQGDLARKYKVSITTVYNIIYGLTWQDLPAVVPEDQVAFEAEESLNKLATAEPVDLDPATIERLNRELSSQAAEEPVQSVEEVLSRRGGQSSEQGKKVDQGQEKGQGSPAPEMERSSDGGLEAQEVEVDGASTSEPSSTPDV